MSTRKNSKILLSIFALICVCLLFAIYVNKLSGLADFSQMAGKAIIYHLFSPIGCLLLLFLVAGTSRRKMKFKKATKKTFALQNKNTSSVNMFCPNCGAQISQDNIDTQDIGLIGFSDRFNNPEILAAAHKNKKKAIGCLWILVFIPLIGFPAAGLFMGDFPFKESIIIGVGIASTPLIINIFALYGPSQPMWEGIVTNKLSKRKYEHKNDVSKTYTEYTVTITTYEGKKKNIVEKDNRQNMYDYLTIGDRVRYHPRFGTYEKYDKSKDQIIFCNVCSMMNHIQNDRCKRCNNLLFK